MNVFFIITAAVGLIVSIGTLLFWLIKAQRHLTKKINEQQISYIKAEHLTAGL